MNQYKYRKNIIGVIFILISFIFIIKLFMIQVINSKYKFSANNNVLRYDVLEPVRGLVFDRDSNLIVSKKVSENQFIDSNPFECFREPLTDNGYVKKLDF